MRRWIFFLAVLGGIYAFYRISGRKEDRSPFRKRLSEAFAIIVWALLSIYIISFLYWIFTQVFK